MATALIIDSSLWELQREAMVDIGSGQAAYLVTTTAPSPSSLVIGVGEDTFVTDVIVNITHFNHTLTPSSEDVVSTSESVSLLLQDYSALVFDQEFITESVVVQRPGTVQTNPLTDAVTTSENVVVFSEGANPPNALFEASPVTESVSAGPVPNPSANETSAITEDTTAEVAGP